MKPQSLYRIVTVTPMDDTPGTLLLRPSIEDAELVGFIGERRCEDAGQDTAHDPDACHYCDGGGEWVFHFEDETPDNFVNVRPVYAPVATETTNQGEQP